MSNEEIRTGTIKNIVKKKGFGFITCEETSYMKDIFFHAKQVVDPKFKSLKIGMPVNYLIGAGKKGPEAVSVVEMHGKAIKATVSIATQEFKETELLEEKRKLLAELDAVDVWVDKNKYI